MKILLILLLLNPEWVFIKEMSGPIPNQDGLIMNTYVSEIARGDDIVKLSVRLDFPWGYPQHWVDIASSDFDITSITRATARVELNCKTLVAKTMKGYSDVYQFNGKKHKSKEIPITLDQSHIFAQYFCEFDQPPSNKLPTLKRSGDR